MYGRYINLPGSSDCRSIGEGKYKYLYPYGVRMPEGRVAGAPRPGAKAKLKLYTTYQVKYDEGIGLEDTVERRQIEDELQQKMDGRLGIVDTVELHPAGRVIGVDIQFNTSSVNSEEEHDVLNMLDQEMNNRFQSPSRPAPDEFDYEWQAV
jgi:hypothetical protein